MPNIRVQRDVGAQVTVVVLGGGRGQRLDPLTRMRSKPAVPLAGKYRLIDVPLSNAIHSGMERIFVLTQFNSVSLHRHLAATYKFSPFSRGFVEVLAAQQTPSDESWFQGTADAVRQNIEFIAELGAKHVLILSGDHLYRMDYRMMLRDQMVHDADVTIGVLPCSESDIAQFGAVRVDDTGRVVAFREKPATADERRGFEIPDQLREQKRLGPDCGFLASMGIYLFKQDVLQSCLDGDDLDFGKDVLPAVVESHRVQAHLFKGYWQDIGTIRAFYDAHMQMLSPTPPFSFFSPDWVIYTHPRYLPGTRMDDTHIVRSSISDGAIIADSTLDNSIVGIRSRIRGATVRRTLIMGADEEPHDIPGAPQVGIGRGSVVAGAIIDKNARVGKNVRLVNAAGVQSAEGDGWMIRDGIIVLPKDAVVPDGTSI